MAAYTGIGSRTLPENIKGIMEDAGYRLARMGFKLRSGKAPGSDEAFQIGMQLFAAENFSTNEHLAEIYIPWRGFEGGPECGSRWDITLGQVDLEFPGHQEMRWDWVREVHPAPDKLSQGARKLHERNVHQLFGRDLGNAYLNQSKFVLYYSKEDKKGNPKGGTATAVNLAKKQGIRTLNLLHESNWIVLENFLKDMENKRGIGSS